MSKLNITCEEFARFQSHDWEGLIVKAAEAALALDVENERLRADAEERTKLTGDALQAEGECAALRTENARLTAALAEHRAFVAWHLEHGSLEGDEATPTECQVRYSSDEIAWHDAATERLMADPTGSEAAARVQALQRSLGHLVVLVLQTSTDQDVLDIARGVTIEYVDGEPQAAL